MKVKENEKALIVNGNDFFTPYNGKVVEVKRIYTEVNPSIAYVEVEEDPTTADIVGLKVPLANLVPIETEPKIPEGAREISKDDFDAALEEITSLGRMVSNAEIDPVKAFLVGFTTRIVGKEVSEKLFENQSSIIVTEDQFIGALWDACNPVSVSESIENKMSVRKCAHVSLTAMIDLLKIVSVFFCESVEGDE